ncbi:unnamed protein product, partial [Discosporangium mesarthrocarpum]
MDRAEVTSICFNQPGTFVACCSDRGTVHIFSLQGGVGGGGGVGATQVGTGAGAGAGAGAG